MCNAKIKVNCKNINATASINALRKGPGFTLDFRRKNLFFKPIVPDTVNYGFDNFNDTMDSLIDQDQQMDSIKKEYDVINIGNTEYYAPWLAMKPLQGEVELYVYIDLQEDADKQNVIEGRIEIPARNGISIYPDNFTIKEYIQEDISSITIQCSKPLSKNTPIDFFFVKNGEKLNKSKNNLVGRINFIRNDVDFRIDIRVVKVCLDDHRFSSKQIDKIQATSGGIANILKNISNANLSQALIELNPIYEEDFVFKPNTLLKVNEGINPETGLEDLEYANYKGLIVNKETMSVDPYKFKAYIGARHKLAYPNLYQKPGLILFTTAINASEDYDVGALGSTSPRKAKTLMVFNSNLQDEVTYAHEIGHVLGLEHTFIDDSIKNQINISDTCYDLYNNERQRVLTQLLSHPSDSPQYKKLDEDYTLLLFNRYKFKREDTYFIMDYSDIDYTLACFAKWQWDIMQGDALQYYMK